MKRKTIYYRPRKHFSCNTKFENKIGENSRPWKSNSSSNFSKNVLKIFHRPEFLCDLNKLKFRQALDSQRT